jgi:MerR family mercuric resistance operon transcriptional regulator
MMKIGQLAERVGVSVQTLRYYERRGLLPEPERTESGYRSYDHNAYRRLRFILMAKGLGFTLSEIQELIDLRVDPATSVEDVRARAHRKIQITKDKIADLERLLAGLERLVARCDAGGSPHECVLMHSLDVQQAT